MLLKVKFFYGLLSILITLVIYTIVSHVGDKIVSTIPEYSNGHNRFYSFKEVKDSLEPLAKMEVNYKDAVEMILDRPLSEACFYQLLISDSIVLCDHRESPRNSGNIYHWVVILTIKNDKVASIDVTDNIHQFDLSKNLSEKKISNFHFGDYDTRRMVESVLLRKHSVGSPAKNVIETLENSKATFKNKEHSEDDNVLYLYHRPRQIFDWRGWWIKIKADKHGNIVGISVSQDKRII